MFNLTASSLRQINTQQQTPVRQASSLRQINTQQQTPVRQAGFGVRFKDTPPTFINETKQDNKIERKQKPKCPKGHKVCKCKKNKNKLK